MAELALHRDHYIEFRGHGNAKYIELWCAKCEVLLHTFVGGHLDWTDYLGTATVDPERGMGDAYLLQIVQHLKSLSGTSQRVYARAIESVLKSAQYWDIPIPAVAWRASWLIKNLPLFRIAIRAEDPRAVHVLLQLSALRIEVPRHVPLRQLPRLLEGHQRSLEKWVPA